MRKITERALLGLCMLALCGLTACDDDSSSEGGTTGGGAAGAGAAGGTPGGSGGGEAGSGGAVGGAGGQAGAGGAVGGAGGQAGAGGMTGGAGGQAGAGGAAGGPGELQFCQEECQTADDCLDGHRCDEGRCWPESVPTQCEDDNTCVALFSGWLTAMGCEATADCDGGEAGTQACVDFDGMGICAFIQGEFIDCETLGMERVNLPLREGGGEVEACSQTRAECRDNICTIPCRGDMDCSLTPEYPVCNVESGRCVCAEGSCMTNASICGDDGICRCAGNEDCTEGAVDTCIDGFCGCSGPEVCTGDRAHPNTAWVCEPAVILD